MVIPSVVAHKAFSRGDDPWSCDYPHGESVFGESRSEIKKIFDLLGEDKAKDVVGGNAAKLWNL